VSDPATSTGAVAIAASLSAISIALIGVDYYAVVWGMLGALVRLAFDDKPTNTVKSAIAVAASTVAASATAHGLAEMASTPGSRGALVSSAFFIGFGAQLFLQSAVEAAAKRLQKFGDR
jgi:hypothetical protein